LKNTVFKAAAETNSRAHTQSQIRKSLRFASPQIANPQICNDKSANRKPENFLGVPARELEIRKFARKKAVFLIPILIGLPLILFRTRIF
jgi:hypothetical protein